MNHREEMLRAVAIAASALGLDIASGRAMAAFYAQTALASWLGILFSGLCFGAAVGFLSAFARRMGAGSLRLLLRRLGCGRLVSVLHILALLAAACMAVGEAGHMGALALPVSNGQIYGAMVALTAACALALSGRAAIQGFGTVFLVCMSVCLTALLCFAEMPQTGLDYGLELKLENNAAAALVLALLHAAVAVCISAGAAVKLGSIGVCPARLGVYSGAVYGLVLALGNAALEAQEPIILRLKLPFAALCCTWGTPGFYIGAVMVYMGSIATLAGIIYGIIPKRKSRILIEN